jgi:hypothetical protein
MEVVPVEDQHVDRLTVELPGARQSAEPGAHDDDPMSHVASIFCRRVL